MRVFYSIILSCFILTSCKGQKDNMKAKNTPEVTQMLESYNKQEHRIAINGCEMTYNEKAFTLGMTVKELIKVFGEYDEFTRGFFIWKDAGFTASINCEMLGEKLNINKETTYLYIYLNTKVSEKYKHSLAHELNHKKDYFLLEGMPVIYNMKIKDFISNSKFNLGDFGVSNSGYELDYTCNGKKIGYRLKADNLWLSKGTGHLTLKDKPNPENNTPFELIYITEISE